MKNFGTKRNYLVTLTIMIIGAIIFLNSIYWEVVGLTIRTGLALLIAFVMVVVIPFLVVKISFINGAVTNIINYFIEKAKIIKQNWKKTVCYTLAYVTVTIVALVMTWIIGIICKDTWNEYLFYFIATLAYMFLSIFFLRKNVTRKPEVLFVVLAMLMGLFFIKVSPAHVTVSWDEETHYQRTLALSNFFDDVMYEADEKVLLEHVFNYMYHIGYEREQKAAYLQQIEELYEQKTVAETLEISGYGVYSVGYIPAAIGIIFARGLSLPWECVFLMGPIFNLITYVALFYFAIKKLKCGKMLLACIGLIPTSIFMASSYSYDYWLIGFVALSFSYFFSILQAPKEKIKTEDIYIMTGTMLLGCMVKAVYFVLLFPMLFVAKERFASKKQRKLWYVAIVVTGLLLVGSFLLPMLFQGAGTGDIRGGADVNSTEQIKFILSNPIQYTKIFFNYLKGYLELDNSGGYIQNFAVVGMGTYSNLVLITIFVTALWNKREEREHMPWTRAAGILAAFGTIVLVITALYISFTPVGHYTVNGCQYRYIIPVLFPLLYLMCGTGNERRTYRTNEVIWPMLIIAMTFMMNMKTLIINLF